MPKTPELDDLLQPALGVEHDTVGMGRPWRPWSLVFLGALGGSLAAGPLAAWNFRWLGRPRLTLPVALFMVVWWLGGLWAAFELHGRARFEAGLATNNATEETARAEDADGAPEEVPDWEKKRVFWRPILRILDLAPVLGVIWLQHRRFRVFTGSGGEPRSLWIAGICAILAMVAVSLVVVPILFRAWT